MKKKIVENLLKSLLIILIWSILDFITGSSITLKENIIGFIIIFVVEMIIDYFKEKKNK